MTSKEIIKEAEKLGWIYVSTNGSHRKYKHPESRRLVVIPFHPGKDLAPGTLNQIKKAIGLK